MIFLFDILINVIDFLIIHKFFDCFCNKRNCNKQVGIGVFVCCIGLISIVNQFDNPNVNVLILLAMIYLYSFTFTYTLPYRIVLPILYIGLGFVAELFNFVLLSSFDDVLRGQTFYYVGALLCEIWRFLIVLIVCQIRDFQLPNLPKSFILLLLLIPVFSIIICCITINIIKINESDIGRILCVVVTIITVTNNILIFKLFSKLVDVMSENHNNAMLLQEAKAKELFYKEVEKSNNQVREIKHNLKNTLLAIYAKNSEENTLSKDIKVIVDELDMSDKNIYTKNVIFNTIINNKVNQTRNENINIDVSVMIPQYMNLDYKDAGVLLGNMLDNAIEACYKLDEAKRWIKINILYRSGMLLITVCNSKENKTVDISKSSKVDTDNHGIGIPSMKRIIKKHNGVIEFIDNGYSFEVSASLYGVESKTR